MQAAAACLLRGPTTRLALAASLRTASGASASASASASAAAFSTRALRAGPARPLPPRIGGPAAAQGRRNFTAQSSWWESLRASAARAAASVEKGLPPALKPSSTRLIPPPGAPPGTTARVFSLHADAFWQAHGPKVLGVAAAAATYGAWKLTSAVGRAVDGAGGDGGTRRELTARQALVAAGAAVALVAAAAAAFRARYALSPDAVYRAALARLNRDPGLLELMGAPLAGSPARAVVETGGGLRLRPAGGGSGRRSFLGLPLPAPRSRRIHMVFPLAGSARRGLAAVEAKKRGGRLVFRVLAVDLPVERAGVPAGTKASHGGSPVHASPYWEHRVFLEGDDAAYGRGDVFGGLRPPLSHALALRRLHDEEDDLDDAATAAALAAAARADAAAAVLAGGGEAPPGPSWWWLRRRK
jgi:hypothetical protein